MNITFRWTVKRVIFSQDYESAYKQTERKLDSFARVLLLTSAYSAYAVNFFMGQFPNMEWMLLLFLPLFLTEILYFSGQYNASVNITLFLTGCLCALIT